MSFHFFFTRKLFFVKEADGLVLCPGGFGTLDEALEVLTLIPTGKSHWYRVVSTGCAPVEDWQGALDLSAASWKPIAISCLPTSSWCGWCTALKTVEEINQFYANFHSTRWLKRQFVVRMNHPLSDRALAHLQSEFASLRLSGEFQQLAYTGEEHDEARFSHLTRLVFNFNGQDQGRLRELVEYIDLPEELGTGSGEARRRSGAGAGLIF